MKKIYLFKSIEQNNYKIGITKNIEKRKKELSTGNPNSLICIYEFESNFPYKVESLLHKYFKHKNICNEWFNLDDNDINEFKKLCKMYETNISYLKDKNYYINKWI